MKKQPQFDIFFVVLTCMVLLACFVYCIVFEDDISSYENRPAAKVQPFSLSEFLDSTWQDGLEDALMDQMPLSETLKRFYNNSNTTVLAMVMEPIMDGRPERYVSFRGLELFGGEYLCYRPKQLSDIQSGIDRRTANLNESITRNPQVDFYLYYIQCDGDVNFETGEMSGIWEYLSSRMILPQEQMGYLEVPDFETYSRFFYKTDHHWNYAGAHAGYLEAARLLGVGEEDLLQPLETMTAPLHFSGTRANTAGTGVLKESFSAYRYDLPEMKVTLNGSSVERYGVDFEDYYNPGVYPGYTSYYGYDEGEVVFDTGLEADNLLVLGNSFDNAIVQLLASHFGRTHSVDLRYFETDMGKAFDLDTYLRENEIQKVLLIGDNSYFSGDLFMMGGN